MEKQYTLIAGVNGAGKSTFYLSHPEFFEGTLRLNADEILQEQSGDWRKQSDNAKSMRDLIHRMDDYFSEEKSFHHETTLSGNIRGFEKRIKQAKALGYNTTLIYIYLANANLAIERVNQRVEKGGHGVPEEVIRRRYTQSMDNFKKLHEQFDNVIVLNNSDMYSLIYRKQGNIEWYDFLPEKMK